MVVRITYGGDDEKTPGESFTAADAEEIRDAVNALGTAADANTGTSAGNVPVLDADGKLPVSVIPSIITGDATPGDVVGPASVNDGRVALFDGTTGKLLKEAAATQVLPASGTDGYWLTYTAGAPAWATVASLANALEGDASMSYVAMSDLDSSGAGEKMETALIASTSATDGQVIYRSGSALAGLTLGTSALLDAMPTGAPGEVSSSSGAIPLNFSGVAVLTTTTTEAITSITFSNIAAYSDVCWIVKQTTARNITFPSGTKISGTAGSLTYGGVANSFVRFFIYNDNGTYVVTVGDEHVVGA